MTDISREAVERHIGWLRVELPPDKDNRRADVILSCIEALRDALDKAEKDDEAAYERGFRAGCEVESVRTDKAERERDEAEQAARVEASARRRFIKERDEALEALRPFAMVYDANFEDERSLHMTAPASDLTFGNLRVAHDVLAKHEVKP